MTVPVGVCKDCGRNRLEREPHMVDCVTNRRTLGAKVDVVRVAIALSDCAAESDGDMAICGEYLEALWGAVERLKRAEAASGDR